MAAKTKMIQIRNIPPELHRRLKVRAAEEGLTMSDFVMRYVRRALEVPSQRELLERLSKLPPSPPLIPSAAEIIRAHRDAGAGS